MALMRFSPRCPVQRRNVDVPVVSVISFAVNVRSPLVTYQRTSLPLACYKEEEVKRDTSFALSRQVTFRSTLHHFCLVLLLRIR